MMPDIAAKRHEYLRRRRQLEEAGYTDDDEANFDEAAVVENEVTKSVWVDTDLEKHPEKPLISGCYGLHTPTGSGTRYCVTAAFTSKGFLPHCTWIFAAGKADELKLDPHCDMNGANYVAYFQRCLDSSDLDGKVVTLDNAKIHRLLVEGTHVPTISATKQEMIDWLHRNGIEHGNAWFNSELQVRFMT